MSSKPSTKLSIKIKSFTNETHNLIDYYSTSYIRSTFNVDSSGIITNENNKLSYKMESEDLLQYKLLGINANENNYTLTVTKYNDEKLSELDVSKYFWMSYHGKAEEVEQSKKQIHILQEGDIIKVGKTLFKCWAIENLNEREFTLNSKRVRNLNNSLELESLESNAKVLQYQNFEKRYDVQGSIFSSQIVVPKLNSESGIYIASPPRSKFNEKNLKCNLDDNENKKSEILNLNSPEKENETKNKFTCRICYGDDSSEENPLFHPCKCIGSVGYIHYSCLKNWLCQKSFESSLNNYYDSTYITYNLTDNYCEICKSKYPDFLNYNGRLYNLIFYTKEFKKYVIFELLFPNNENKRTIMILNTEKNLVSYTIGRSSEADINLPDLAVSRFHFTISRNNNNILLEDIGSKYGTLVLLQNPNIKLNMDSRLRLRHTKYYIKLLLTKKFGLFSCCQVMETDIKKEYWIQNKKCLNPYKNALIKKLDKDGGIEESAEIDKKENKKENVKRSNIIEG